jgi:hypothetical protein
VRVFNTKENGPIYISEDDLQVAAAIQLGYKMMMDAYDEAEKRGLFETIAKVSPVQRDLVRIYAEDNEWQKLGRLVYDTIYRLLPKSQELE